MFIYMTATESTQHEVLSKSGDVQLGHFYILQFS